MSAVIALTSNVLMSTSMARYHGLFKRRLMVGDMVSLSAELATSNSTAGGTCSSKPISTMLASVSCGLGGRTA